jgi:hypothetical protein
MPEKPEPKPEDIELHPDAWERFEQFIKRIARAGPQHRKPNERPEKERANPPRKS